MQSYVNYPPWNYVYTIKQDPCLSQVITSADFKAFIKAAAMANLPLEHVEMVVPTGVDENIGPHYKRKPVCACGCQSESLSLTAKGNLSLAGPSKGRFGVKGMVQHFGKQSFLELFKIDITLISV